MQEFDRSLHTVVFTTTSRDTFAHPPPTRLTSRLSPSGVKPRPHSRKPKWGQPTPTALARSSCLAQHPLLASSSLSLCLCSHVANLCAAHSAALWAHTHLHMRAYYSCCHILLICICHCLCICECKSLFDDYILLFSIATLVWRSIYPRLSISQCKCCSFVNHFCCLHNLARYFIAYLSARV